MIVMNLTVIQEKQDTLTILKIKGTLDISTTNLIEHYLNEIDDHVELLIFDFCELEFIDSTGIGSIIDAIHLSQEKTFKVQFKNVNEVIEEIFDILGLYQILQAVQGEVV
jgi:anti-anti-sigma factor